METLIDFDAWLNNYPVEAVTYEAVYDEITGRVISIGPSYAFQNEKYKLPIDTDIAELVIEGKISISTCFVDIQNSVMEIAETKSVFKIDDVLHRIVSLEYAEFKNPDVILTYTNQSLTFALSDEYNGTRKINWDGETVMNFLITDYNDPNILYNMLSLKISDLVGKTVTVNNLDCPPKFSVYTRRLFKNYVIEYK
jgi:hypothetical protein